MTHVAGASSEERRTRLFGTCKFQPIKGPAETWEAERLDVTRAALDAFAQAASGGPPYPIPTDEMIHGVAVTEAIVRSASSDKSRKSIMNLGRLGHLSYSTLVHPVGQLGADVAQPAHFRAAGEGESVSQPAFGLSLRLAAPSAERWFTTRPRAKS